MLRDIHAHPWRTRRACQLLAAGVAVLVLSGCGIKGPLKPPPAVPATTPPPASLPAATPAAEAPGTVADTPRKP